MEPAKFTPPELEQLVAQAISWMQEQRGAFFPSGHPLTEEQKANLRLFFSAEILDRLRIAEASKTGQKIPYPPFYEKVRRAARVWCPMPRT
jgi:hypothetical protein